MTISKKGFLAAGISMMLAFALAACNSQQESTDPEPESTDPGTEVVEPDPVVMVLDMKGDECVEAGTVKTILTVNSVATQMVLMCGGESAAATLGQGFQYGDDSLNIKMFPNLGGLKTFTRADATVENVAAIDPGLVVIDVPDTVAALREADIPVAYLSVTSPETIMQAVQMIGEAMGGDAEAKAAQYCTYYNGVLEEMGALAAKVSGSPKVLYLRSETKTIGAGSMPDSWITTLGGVNVGAELGASGGAGSDVTTEAIIGADPDIIICENAALVETILTDAKYADMTAVKNGAVYQAPLGTAVWSMGTAEAPLMVYWASQYINPDAFTGIDPDKKTIEFFQEFYGYTLSGYELDGIFHRTTSVAAAA